MCDLLIGLFNCWYMLDCFCCLLNLVKVKGEKVYMIYLDVDYFKKFNDNYGYDVGDNVLSEVVNCL